MAKTKVKVKYPKKGEAKKKFQKKVKTVMGEFKDDELNIGKSSKKVKNRAQAVAIALSEAKKGTSKKRKPKKVTTKRKIKPKKRAKKRSKK